MIKRPFPHARPISDTLSSQAPPSCTCMRCSAPAPPPPPFEPTPFYVGMTVAEQEASLKETQRWLAAHTPPPLPPIIPWPQRVGNVLRAVAPSFLIVCGIVVIGVGLGLALAWLGLSPQSSSLNPVATDGAIWDGNGDASVITYGSRIVLPIVSGLNIILGISIVRQRIAVGGSLLAFGVGLGYLSQLLS